MGMDVGDGMDVAATGGADSEPVGGTTGGGGTTSDPVTGGGTGGPGTVSAVVAETFAGSPSDPGNVTTFLQAGHLTARPANNCGA